MIPRINFIFQRGTCVIFDNVKLDASQGAKPEWSGGTELDHLPAGSFSSSVKYERFTLLTSCKGKC